MSETKGVEAQVAAEHSDEAYELIGYALLDYLGLTEPVADDEEGIDE